MIEKLLPGDTVTDQARQRAKVLRAVRNGQPVAVVAARHKLAEADVRRLVYDFPGPAQHVGSAT